MDFGQAIASGFQGYVRFTGRASRPEFWYWILFIVVVSVVASVLDALLFSVGKIGVLNLVWSLATLLPSIAVNVRRLHDIDKSGWWYLLWFVPVIGWIILIIWVSTAGTAGANRFGADPLANAAPA